MAKIKICGLKSLDDISYVNQAKIDYAGFIFYNKSKRYISEDIALTLKNNLDNNIKSVGVFVNQDLNTIKNIAQKKIIDLIQLHGNENGNFISALKKETNLEIIKAMKADENLEKNINSTIADYILIDSFNNNQFGGTGKTFDYNLIPKTNKKIFIAGGLNIENIFQALNLNPYCVDINSSVETQGKKDREKILQIVNKIKEKDRLCGRVKK